MKETWTRRLNTARLFAVIIALLAIACYFLPMYSATKDIAEALDGINDVSELVGFSDTFGLQPSEMKQLSLFRLAKMYTGAADSSFPDHATHVFYIAVTVAPAVLTVLALLWAALKRPVLSLLNAVLFGGAYYLALWTLDDVNLLSSGSYVKSVAYFGYWAPIALLAIAAIWMKVCRSGLKKAA